MAYVFKQKLQIHELANIKVVPKKVLIHEPEDYLANLYAHYLRSHNFFVSHCPNLEILSDFSGKFLPDVLVFNIESSKNLNFLTGLLPNFKKDFPNTSIVTTSFNNNAESLKKLMYLGVSSHLNRKFTRPQDLAAIIRAILQTNL